MWIARRYLFLFMLKQKVTVVIKYLIIELTGRSKNKPTFPGILDNMVAGGISVGIGIKETMIKECEEAGIPEELAKNVVPVGMIR